MNQASGKYTLANITIPYNGQSTITVSKFTGSNVSTAKYNIRVYRNGTYTYFAQRNGLHDEPITYSINNTGDFQKIEVNCNCTFSVADGNGTMTDIIME